MLRNFSSDSGAIHRRQKPKFTLSPQWKWAAQTGFKVSVDNLEVAQSLHLLSPSVTASILFVFFLLLIENETCHMKHEAELERNLEFPLSLPVSEPFLASQVFFNEFFLWINDVNMFFPLCFWCHLKISRPVYVSICCTYILYYLLYSLSFYLLFFLILCLCLSGKSSRKFRCILRIMTIIIMILALSSAIRSHWWHTEEGYIANVNQENIDPLNLNRILPK